jgi:hypothetical protein
MSTSLLVRHALQATPLEVPGINSSNQIIDIESCYTAGCTLCDDETWYLSSADYTLSAFTIWAFNNNSFKGVQLTYTNAQGQTLVGSIIGATSGTTPTTYTITKRVTGITMKQNGPN